MTPNPRRLLSKTDAREQLRGLFSSLQILPPPVPRRQRKLHELDTD